MRRNVKTITQAEKALQGYPAQMQDFSGSALLPFGYCSGGML
jgi:hypothetical protein